MNKNNNRKRTKKIQHMISGRPLGSMPGSLRSTYYSTFSSFSDKQPSSLANRNGPLHRNKWPPEAQVLSTITSKRLDVVEMAKFANINLKYAYFEIGIKDNGIGFDPKLEDQVFVAFSRLHSQEKYAGTAIGLALYKKIVTNHQGEILAESKENEGTLFRIILPLTR